VRELSVRPGKPDDLPELQQLFVDTISTICKKDYQDDQISAWISGARNKQRWLDILAKQYLLVAIDQDKIVGFGSLDQGGYLDLMYIHKDYQRQGIASKLYSELESEAIRQGLPAIYADVSKTARSFFEKKGFKVIAEQAILRQGIALTNFKMTKNLPNVQTP
jgi:putative acetyltransferase